MSVERHEGVAPPPVSRSASAPRAAEDAAASRHSEFDPERARRDFPILGRSVDGKPLVYLDNAATAQTPELVIETVARWYREARSNIHRGAHQLSLRATEAYEAARGSVQRFINADDPTEVIFTRGCTEAINLVAHGYRDQLRSGDEVIVSEMEHHSNLVPWQQLCRHTGAALRIIPIADDGQLELDAYHRLLSPRTKLVAVAHVSNALGTVNPVREIAEAAHARGAQVLLDGAQSIVHLEIDVRQLDCDFFAFSGHKLYGPTGIGALYGRRELLDRLAPYQTGGGMVDIVELEQTSFLDSPQRFEAGTPNIAGALGLGAAIDYLERLGMAKIAAYEAELLVYAERQLSTVEGLRMIGTAPRKASVLSFVLPEAHPSDIGTLLDQQGVAIRAGHHCAQPTMRRMGVPATARASLALYNTRAEVDALVTALHKVVELFS